MNQPWLALTGQFLEKWVVDSLGKSQGKKQQKVFAPHHDGHMPCTLPLAQWLPFETQ